MSVLYLLLNGRMALRSLLQSSSHRFKADTPPFAHLLRRDIRMTVQALKCVRCKDVGSTSINIFISSQFLDWIFLQKLHDANSPVHCSEVEDAAYIVNYFVTLSYITTLSGADKAIVVNDIM